jgi:hypothetical protein
VGDWIYIWIPVCMRVLQQYMIAHSVRIPPGHHGSSSPLEKIIRDAVAALIL